MRTILFTSAALTAFALNSLLCRMALGAGEADAAGFTLVRLASGAVAMLGIITVSQTSSAGGDNKFRGGRWTPAFFLFGYAFAFSFAYIGLSAGTGALILFGSVQITMLAISKFRGERIRRLEWLGLLVALGGFLFLVLPGLHAPPLMSFVLMTAAGICWGAYSIIGQTSSRPLFDTAGNFLRSVPLILLAALFFLNEINLTSRGWALAVASGVVGSGLGYAAWYAALPSLSAIRAATLQLAVPVIAALGGIIFLAEVLSFRIIVAGTLILGGIALTNLGRKRSTGSQNNQGEPALNDSN